MQASAAAPVQTAVPDLLYSLEAPNEQNGTPAGAAPDSPLVQQQLDTPPVTAASTVQPVEFISLRDLFVLFFSIGLRAFGGPVAQIALLKQIVCTEKKWVTTTRFQRAFSVYQVLPGPEAHELCCWAGFILRGRIGSFLAGLGFMLPGFMLMLGAAVLYREYGLTNAVVLEVFAALQPAVAALVCRAVHKIGDHVIRDPGSHALSPPLLLVAVIAALESLLGVNFFLILIHTGTLYGFCLHPKRQLLSVIWAIGPLAAFVAVVATLGSFDALLPKAVGAGKLSNLPGATFLVGLEGGLLTFGGAYTAIPIVYFETVTTSGWLTQQQFLDSIAVGQVLPSPLVIFVTFVGYLADTWAGAFCMTAGMFLPAFSFTLIGHHFFESIVESKGVIVHVLDGISSAVVGLILVSALQILRNSVLRPIDAVIFMFAGAMLVSIKHRYVSVAVVGLAIIAGLAFHQRE